MSWQSWTAYCAGAVPSSGWTIVGMDGAEWATSALADHSYDTSALALKAASGVLDGMTVDGFMLLSLTEDVMRAKRSSGLVCVAEVCNRCVVVSVTQDGDWGTMAAMCKSVADNLRSSGY